MLTSLNLMRWNAELRDQIDHTILPYWDNKMIDPRGGHYGGRGLQDELNDHLPRTAVLGTRLLWTFATAARLTGDARWRGVAEHAWVWMRDVLTDPVHGGVFWSVTADRRVLADHKQSYAQGFAIYAAAAWARAGGSGALDYAQSLYQLLEAAHDPRHGGYFEGCSRDWQVKEDARLSLKEPPAAKSMNTMLHVLEGLTELLRVWPDEHVRDRLMELTSLFIDKIWHPQRRSFGLFFEPDWTPIGETISYGHDIEAAWLLRRACEVLPGWARAGKVDRIAAQVAQAVLERGVAPDGSVLAEGQPDGPTAWERHWWAQAEAMVGFWDAHQLTGDATLAEASWRCWDFIRTRHVDPVGGDWFKVLDRHGSPIRAYGKAGPWECPYHHARACFEMLDRLGAAAHVRGSVAA